MCKHETATYKWALWQSTLELNRFDLWVFPEQPDQSQFVFIFHLRSLDLFEYKPQQEPSISEELLVLVLIKN